jgi:LmbE family N-acetylglucosaminyl deacetylase
VHNSDLIEPAGFLCGPVAVLAPHMDDEVLGCGATLAAVAVRHPVHVIYLTDGARSPAPPRPWIGPSPSDLAAIRADEARRATQRLGIPTENLYFLDLPDGRLARLGAELRSALASLLRAIQPRYLLVPFRFDRHPDHLAANRAAVETVAAQERDGLQIIEYFVYYRSRMLKERDIRRYIRSDQLVRVNTGLQSAQKRSALECYQSQTTVFYEWQHRPILSAALVQEVCDSPEAFVIYSASRGKIFDRRAGWIRLTHAVEPRLKRAKEWAIAMVKSLSRAVTGSTGGRSAERS